MTENTLKQISYFSAYHVLGYVHGSQTNPACCCRDEHSLSGLEGSPMEQPNVRRTVRDRHSNGNIE